MTDTKNPLEQIVTDPGRVASVPVEQVPALLVQLASVQAILLSRLAVTGNGSATQSAIPPPVDHYLTADEAAAIHNVSRRWLYPHARQLPFAHRVNRKLLRFSEAHLRRWQAARRT